MNATKGPRSMFLLGAVAGLALLSACTAEVAGQTQAERNLPQTCTANAPDPRACEAGNTKKTTVCHIPPGNPANAHTICVGNASVPAHIDHGDFVGTCSCTGTGSGSDGGGGDGSGSGGGGGGTGSGGGGGTGDGGGGGLY